jgi:hypothetical protein
VLIGKHKRQRRDAGRESFGDDIAERDADRGKCLLRVVHLGVMREAAIAELDDNEDQCHQQKAASEMPVTGQE